MKNKKKLLLIIPILIILIAIVVILIINTNNTKTFYIYKDNNKISITNTLDDNKELLKEIKCINECTISNEIINDNLLLQDDKVYLININNDSKIELPNLNNISNLKLSNNSKYIINTNDNKQSIYSINKKEYITQEEEIEYTDEELLYGITITENKVNYTIITNDESKKIVEEREEIGKPSLELLSINDKSIIVTTDSLNLDKYYYAYDNNLNILFNNNRIKYIDNLSNDKLLLCFDNSISILNNNLEEESNITKYSKILSVKLGLVIGVINNKIYVDNLDTNESLYLTDYNDDLFIFDNDYQYDDKNLTIYISSIETGEIVYTFKLNRNTFTLE